MFGIKLFTKSDVIEVLNAAGLSFQDAYNMAVTNLRDASAKQQECIATNKQVIVKAEAAIKDATAVLEKTNKTLEIVNRIGG